MSSALNSRPPSKLARILLILYGNQFSRLDGHPSKVPHSPRGGGLGSLQEAAAAAERLQPRCHWHRPKRRQRGGAQRRRRHQAPRLRPGQPWMTSEACAPKKKILRESWFGSSLVRAPQNSKPQPARTYCQRRCSAVNAPSCSLPAPGQKGSWKGRLSVAPPGQAPLQMLSQRLADKCQSLCVCQVVSHPRHPAPPPSKRHWSTG